MKTKIISSIILLLLTVTTFACEVCQSQQPKIFQGFTHGSGPGSKWEFVIIVVSSIIVLFTLVLSLKYIFRPGEKNADHIKNIVVNQSTEL